MEPPHATRTVEVPGGTIAYDVRGKGVGIVLLHEGIADRRMWDREFSRLANDHRVVRYDLRGYGGSTAASGPYSAVADLAAVIRAAELEQPVIVGPSMGGRIALDFALEHPGAAGGLLLIAPGVSGLQLSMVPDAAAAFGADDRASTAAVNAWKAGDLDAATEHLRGLWAQALRGDDLGRFRQMVRENAREVFADFSGQHEKLDGPPAAPRLEEVRTATHLLAGDADNPAIVHVAKFLAERIPNAQLEIVPGADHLLNLSAPSAFDAALDRFLGRVAREHR